MTEKLYYKDSYISSFTAKVTDIIYKNGKSIVVLDRTAFFPEGGGQRSDTGYIGTVFTDLCEEQNGIVFHRLASEPDFKIGDTVNCKINFEERFARMQAHSGEHIVSGIAHTLFGCENVGFHMDDTLMTVDFDKKLSKEQLAEIEEKANLAVYANVRINTFFQSEKDEEYTYRSKLDNLEDARLVEIEGYDVCACCAPHVKRTGEIGIIKLLTCASHRGGVRITLICGITAFKELRARYNDILTMSDMLCAPHNSVPESVNALLQKMSDIKREEALRQEAELRRITEAVDTNQSEICLFLDNASVESIRKVAVILKEKCKGLIVVMSGNDNEGYAYAITSGEGGVRSLAPEFNNALCGRGGGKDDMIQGRFNTSAQKIKEYFSSRRNNI